MILALFHSYPIASLSLIAHDLSFVPFLSNRVDSMNGLKGLTDESEPALLLESPLEKPADF